MVRICWTSRRSGPGGGKTSSILSLAGGIARPRIAAFEQPRRRHPNVEEHAALAACWLVAQVPGHPGGELERLHVRHAPREWSRISAYQMPGRLTDWKYVRATSSGLARCAPFVPLSIRQQRHRAEIGLPGKSLYGATFWRMFADGVLWCSVDFRT